MKPFEDLAEKVVNEASNLDVSLVDYIEGLKVIQRAVAEALAGAEYDLRRREEEGHIEDRP